MVEQIIADRYQTGESASSIARSLGVSTWLVLNRVRRAGIHVRTKTQNERRLNGVQSPRLKDLVDGVLLGDGSIDGKGFLRLEQCATRRQWVDFVHTILRFEEVDSKIIQLPPRTRLLEGRTIHSKDAVLLYTPSYREFHAERARWYPEGTKVVPGDVRITPISVAHWFAGDGTYNSDGGLFFCTDGFTKTCVDLLVDLLQTQLGIGGAYRANGTRPSQYKVAITRMADAVTLSELIRPYLASCCHYKLRFVRSPKTPAPTRRLTLECATLIREQNQAGVSYAQLARNFNVSTCCIYGIVRGNTYKN